MTADKEEYYRSIGKCIEIDLGEFIGEKFTHDEIRNAVLSGIHNKRLIQAVRVPAQDDIDILEFLKPIAFLVLLFFGIRALIRRF